MITEAHKRNMWVMADVVYNHVGNCAGGAYDYSCITTFPKAEYYHPDCDIDYNNEWSVMNCRIAGLPDLNQSVSFVNQTLLNWTTWYVNNYTFDGLRIDTVKHV